MTKERRKRVHADVHAAIIKAKSHPCTACGGKFPSVCMDFDHLPGFEKSFTIGSPANWTSVARIEAEIAKTQLLCSNCHRILTWERKNGRKADPYAGVPGPEARNRRRLRGIRSLLQGKGLPQAADHFRGARAAGNIP